MERTVTIDLGGRSYAVRIARGLLAELGGAVASLGDVSSAVVISDSTVGGLYGSKALDSLAKSGLTASRLDFPDGERNKTMATYARLMDAVLAITPAIDRHCVIVALGGGLSGDVAGFVAATALRGLRVVQCPTSLLACVDSSVGGKTGIDHPAGKNLIGAFHQPSAVLVDTDALKSLPRQELNNGLAECVKHGVIRDASLLD
ncbi:MAG: iron-containing alcohol dehydrogenase, partial [Planctomycetes bacterium]|nr:iron-containing alcohol dehydrogenase [Planctomycetota bacterium]